MKQLRDIRVSVSLDLPRDITVLLGPSGHGKTSTLNMIAGILQPDAGHISLDEQTLFDSRLAIDLPPEQRQVGYVFQDYALFPHLSVFENVAYGLRARRRRSSLVRERVMATLEQFAIAPLAGALPRTLSAGQRQRVALARALVVEPRVMLMDEPLAALDAQLRPRVRAELKALLRQANVPTLIVSHDPMDAIELQGRVIVMEQGRIVQQGTYESLLSAPASPFVAEFVEANAYRGRVVEVDAGTGSRIRLEAGADIHAITDDLFRHVLVVIYPWDVVLLRTPDMGSIRNVFAGRVASITRLRNRVRVMVEAAFPITAEITGASLEHLELREGSPVYAAVKTTAIRVVATDAPGVEREMTDLEAVPL